MTIEYDEKGKFYTDIVTKISIPSILQTTTLLTGGKLYVRGGERLKDKWERGELFTAVTDAKVYDAAGNIVFSGPFLAVRREQIVWVMPVDMNNDGNKGVEG
jgi:hypothetical protein